MVKHIVLWRLKDEYEGKNKQGIALDIKHELEAMSKLIPSVKLCEVGIHQGVTDMVSDIVLYTEFENWEGLESYQVHPEHVKFKDFVLSRRTERRVIDYEV
jgi:stress responsive alpha/beta barrel protein